MNDEENNKDPEATLKEETLEETMVTPVKTKEEEYLDGWKRCQADFENYRKRQTESQRELSAYLTESLILELLPIVDNFRMSIEHIPKDQEKQSWVVGLLHIQKQLEKVLLGNGAQEIETKIGDVFDPSIHEAVHSQKDQAEEKPSHTVTKIVAAGYRLGSKVIRPVHVIVS